MASFWFDNWTEHGPVIDFVGQAGPRLFRVSLDAKVKDAVLNGAWNLPSARSERSEELQITLTTIVPPDPERGDDVFLWRLPSDSYSTTFSSKGTWEQLRIQSQRVNWAPLVWFKEAVPRCSFILCYLPVMFRGTGNSRPPLLLVRLLQRGVALSGIKSRWPKFTPLPSGSYREHLLQPSNPGSRPKRVIMKLLLQQTAYAIWRERNARIFTPISTPAAALKNAVDRSIRDRLLSYPATDSNPSLLEIYFSCISYPNKKNLRLSEPPLWQPRNIVAAPTNQPRKIDDVDQHGVADLTLESSKDRLRRRGLALKPVVERMPDTVDNSLRYQTPKKSGRLLSKRVDGGFTTATSTSSFGGGCGGSGDSGCGGGGGGSGGGGGGDSGGGGGGGGCGSCYKYSGFLSYILIFCTKIRPSSTPSQVVETGKKSPPSPPPEVAKTDKKKLPQPPSQMLKTEKKKPPPPRPAVKKNTDRRRCYANDVGGVGGGCGGGC
ncbi:unnamed protein product [Microthlaspi erraticum]|uniref:Reverse transcriptase zinc-binding domain-containing protein n=1 Tax=Microthlaspi erraticum TaxID=1685480 RepID=A0A6D2HCS9_9BRAS|nr:unnamed protein product [Microthlaspi erraticum]